MENRNRNIFGNRDAGLYSCTLKPTALSAKRTPFFRNQKAAPLVYFGINPNQIGHLKKYCVVRWQHP